MPGRSPLDVYISEADFQAKVIEAAKYRGWWVYHPWSSRKSERGWPDLSLVRGDTMLFSELKTETGKVTQDQLDVLSRLAKVRTVEVSLWRPSHWPLIDRMLG